MNDKKFLISFLVVVRNEEDYIEQCLKAMIGQTLPQHLYEIIVVDSMSTDRSRQIIEAIIRDNPAMEIQLLDNPRLTLSCGWNIGILSARGIYVIRPDAHALVPSDFLESNLDVLREHPEVSAVGGRLLTLGEGFWGRIIAVLLSTRIGVGSSNFRVGGPAGPSDTVVFGLYKRQDFIDIGGFDEGLDVNQDNVCHARLRASGKILHFDPKINSTYYSRTTLGKLWRQMFRRGQWLVLMLKHQKGNNFSWRYFAPLGFVLLIIGLATAGIERQIFWWLLISLITIYAVCGLFTSANRGLNLWQVFAFPIAMFALHLSYGMGEFFGFLRLPFYRPNEEKIRPLKEVQMTCSPKTDPQVMSEWWIKGRQRDG
ncbi:MAG: glycosyltransferase family 2 protein [Deltaproteobacteria bacterium]|nr:MAG: glycosyltransferase family 2 protein [Deltaproteobacteria bacterium]